MAQCAEPAAESEAPSAAASFANLLASLTAPRRLPADSPWNDDGLADDVATISYEQTLRKQSGVCSPEADTGGDSILAPISDPNRDIARIASRVTGQTAAQNPAPE